MTTKCCHAQCAPSLFLTHRFTLSSPPRSCNPTHAQDEDKDTGQEIHKGSVIRFYVNGKDQGKAFEDLQAGVYYPAASVYMRGQVTYNFGPEFKFPMPDKPDGVAVRAISQLVDLQRDHLHSSKGYLHKPEAWPSMDDRRSGDSDTPEGPTVQ